MFVAGPDNVVTDDDDDDDEDKIKKPKKVCVMFSYCDAGCCIRACICDMYLYMHMHSYVCIMCLSQAPVLVSRVLVEQALAGINSDDESDQDESLQASKLTHVQEQQALKKAFKEVST